MSAQTRESILATLDLPITIVDVPEWSACPRVYVRTLKAIEAESLADWAKGNTRNFLGRAAALFISDEHGNRLFVDEDADALGEKNPTALKRIVEAAMHHNGLDKESAKAAEKNS